MDIAAVGAAGKGDIADRIAQNAAEAVVRMGFFSLRNIQEDLSRIIVSALIDTTRNFSIARHLTYYTTQTDILGDAVSVRPLEMDITTIARILDRALRVPDDTTQAISIIRHAVAIGIKKDCAFVDDSLGCAAVQHSAVPSYHATQTNAESRGSHLYPG